MTELASLLEGLTPEQRRLLMRRLRQMSGQAPAAVAAGPAAPPGGQIARRDRSGPLRLSFGQQRLWFLDRLDPGAITYNLANGVVLQGRLSVGALAAAVDEVVRRHEGLRTTFHQDGPDGEPVQRIAPRLRIELPVVDLRGLPDGARQEAAVAAARPLAYLPYDLERGPLVRVLLLPLEAERHALLIAMHHIVSDGWSFAVFVRELVSCYVAFAASRAPELPELPVQYADYAAWQREYLAGEVLERSLAYWRERLAGAPQLLELPTDRPRPAVRRFRGGRLPLAFSRELSADFKTFSQQQGSSLFMALLAVFQVLLFRYCGQPDILVGAPVAGRDRLEIEGLIGFFVNTLVLRTDLSGDPELVQLLAQVREGMHGAYSHQALPFERLVEELQPQRNLSHSPLFQVVFNLLNVPVGASELPGLRIEPLDLGQTAAMFDLNFTLAESPRGLVGSIEYDTDLFDRSIVERMARHLETLARGAAAAPGRRISELPMLSEAERAQVVREWNDTALEHGRTPLLHELFEASADRDPGAPAVIYGGEVITYGELDVRSGRLAHRLRALSLGPGDLIGVLLDRSAEMVMALLGVLRSGAAYVPLDARYPEARLQWILQAMKVRAVLVSATRLPAVLGLLPELPELRDLVCLDGDGKADPGLLAGRRLWRAADLETGPHRLGLIDRPVTTPDDLAYVIFTSGSTGTPKGVVVRHRPVFNLIDWVNRTFAVGPGDRLLFVTSLSFDLSVYDIFGMLAAGGSIRVASQEEVEDAERLAGVLAGEPVTFWDSAPAALQQLVPFLPRSGGGAALRLVFLSGDWVPLTLPGQIRAKFPGARVVALGGATEATIWSNFHPVVAIESWWKSIPYGRPIQNARYHVLDASLHPCPVGVPGDLYIAGGCLASGYAAAPAVTANQFLPDPFDETPGSVMYRTGDRARFLADGNLEFLGRLDHQVKIRGFRVELGEIEAVLARHPAVERALALVREDRPGDRRLTVYAVPKDRPWPGVEELRAFLRQSLPEYMIPAALVLLEALPLTANGKVDRKALPAPEWVSGETYAAPRTPEEEALAAIWSTLLGIERVGVHDNFFELGGDSILSIQVIARAAQAGLRLSPRQIFEHPTIAGLAVLAERTAPAGAGEGAVTGFVPLTPVQLWLLEQDLPRPEHFNQAVLLEAVEPLAPVALFRAIGDLLAHHDALRMRFEPPAPGRPGWRQVNAGPAPEVPFACVDLTALPPERPAAELERAADGLQASLDLVHGPLLRAVLFRQGSGRADHLLLVIHHLVVDGISWRVLVEDLESSYRQRLRGEEAALPPKTASFKSWAERLAGYAASEEIAAQRAYWLERPVAPSGALARDLDLGPADVASTRTVAVTLPAEETRALLQAVPRAYRTQINDVLLAALVEALAPLAGGRRLLVELEGHGREDVFPDLDLSRTVGWFTSIYPVLLDAEGAATPGEALKTVKEQLRAVPGRGVGFGVLRYLGDEQAVAALRSLPRAEVVFNYFGQLDQAFAAGRLFRPAATAAGRLRHPAQPRQHLFEIGANVSGGQLRVYWSYSADRHLRSTVEGAAERFLTALRTLIDHCQAPEAGGYTPSDFPLARLDGAALRRLAAVAGREVEDLYPATPVQQGMVFHTLSSPGSGVYVQQLSLLFAPPFDADAFERAWQRLAERQPVLRTSFFWHDLDEPLQVVHPRVRLACDRHDWSGLTTGEQEERLCAHLEADRRRGFDLAAPPLLRLALFDLGAVGHRFLWSFHHALMDGWSLPILFRELFLLYEAARSGEEARLERPAPYREYIVWLSRQDMGAAEEFWRRTLAGARPAAGLRDGRAVTRPDSPRTSSREVQLSAAATDGLRRFARRHEVTLNTLVHGAWALLLGRYTGEDDVVFGSVSSGREVPVPEITFMVGFFFNTLPARTEVITGRNMVSWLQDFQRRHAEMRRYEYAPLVRIHGWSGVPRGLPLFESVLAFENYPLDESVRERRPGGLEVREVEVLEQNNYPLTLLAVPRSRLRLQVTCDGRRFDPAFAARLAGHLEALLLAFPEAPESPLGALPLLTAAERHQVLVEWNDRRAGYPEESTAPRLFEAQAERSPDAVAAVCDGLHLTYRALDGRAGRLARALAARGVGPEVVVALLGRRDLDLLTAILGVLKAGGAYLPLDPAHPVRRQLQIVRQSGAPMILTAAGFDGGLRPALEAAGDLPERPLLLRLDDLLRQEAGSVAPTPCAPSNLAYVIYTSGSTGSPKGAMVEHRGMLNHLWAKVTDLGLTAGSVVAETASQCFDISVWQFLAALLVGGRVHVADDATTHDPERMLAFTGREQVTVLETVPSLLRGMLEAPALDLDDLGGLSWSIVTGEAFPPDLCRRWLELWPGVPLLNAYGPTECSDDVTHHAIRRWPEDATRPVPIGRPVANFRLYVVDRGGEPVPAGVAGELWVGGDGVGRGYLDDPGRTAQVFVPDPWGSAPGGRLYRTGDLARHLADGTLEFLGRLDHQVKMRGFRIELGEIEVCLREHPAVQEAVVVARDDGPAGVYLAAYAVPAAGGRPDAETLRAALRERLPEYMVPSAFVLLDALPLTANGKVDRRALPAPGAPQRRTAEPPRTAAGAAIAAVWRDVLGLDQVGADDNFFDLGGHSLLLVRVYNRLREAGYSVVLTDLFQYPTVRGLAAFLEGPGEAAEERPSPRPQAAMAATGAGRGYDIAVIGMAGRFPGARDVDELWRNLRDGVETVTFFSDEELFAAGVDPATLANPRYVKAKGVMEDAEMFDAPFFGVPPREAQLMDPQQRVFLECAWETLESAGYDPGRYPGRIGVFAGAGPNAYLLNVYSNPDLVQSVDPYQILIGNRNDFLPTRVSYKLNLRGPSVNVQTACSTSMVAVVTACHSLLQGQCDMALAGGVSVMPSQRSGYLYEEGGIVSPDGRTRAFDAASRGSVYGSGVGIVLLKRLADAVADGDSIRAVIRGAAFNNDGSARVGFTAPSIEGQAEVIAACHAVAGVDPASISYVEAHGTATRLGDPIEVAALTRAFRGRTRERQFCALGSVKTNVGHLDSAAGVTGLIKTVLALEHRQIPPSLHFTRPNPEIDFESSPFFVNTALREWPAAGGPRRAGVSSFGLGGTNAHVVVEEAVPPPPSGPSRPWHLLPLSARTPAALDRATANLRRHLESHPEQDLADVAYTLQVGRRAFGHRRMLVCRDREEALSILGGEGRERPVTLARPEGERRLAFLFPGQGSQHVDMARELYREEPVFRRWMDEALELSKPHVEVDLARVIYPGPDEARWAAGRLAETAVAQPALFAVEHALARLWMEWGLRPQALLGHSFGEYVAACLAGVLSLDDALALVARRGRLIQRLPAGGMLTIPLPERELAGLLDGELAVAAVNSARSCVVSGPLEAVEALQQRLDDQGVEAFKLRARHAFHSDAMGPIAEEFSEDVARVRLAEPRIPYLSNVTGTWITPAEATDPAYWVRHLRQTVRFADALGVLGESPDMVLLEVGPGEALTNLAREHLQEAGGQVRLASLRHPWDPRSDLQCLLGALGRLWLLGIEVDWARFQGHGKRRRVPLPTYPFERQRYWVEAQKPLLAGRMAPAAVARELPVPEPRPALAAGAVQALESRGEAARDYVAPRTELERRLAQLWSELLGVSPVGVRDNFFESGGTSLVAIRLGARLRQKLGVTVQPEHLLEASTIEEMAALVQSLDETSILTSSDGETVWKA